MGIWKQVLFKWFGLEDPPCETCEVLRERLVASERERRELLQRILTPEPLPTPSVSTEEPIPLTPQFTPWRIRKQLLEAEDRKKAELLRAKAKELANAGSQQSIDALEKEL